jgi:hypothetical protein
VIRVDHKPLSGLLEGSVESTASELGLDREVLESRRPALVRLCLDVEDLVDELRAGFEDRSDVLRWGRRMIPRTLGEVRTEFYRALAEQFRAAGPRGDRRIDDVDRERTLLSALLEGSSRSREIPPDAVGEIRRDVATEVIDPAFRRAFRSLRKSATEYVDDEDSEDSDHDPARQRYIAMRPALDELDEYQRRATGAVLEGLEDADQLRRWSTLVELASHGEIDDDVLRRSCREESTIELLTSGEGSDAQERGRELFVAFYLLPAFNRGVRDLRDRAKEEPDADRVQKSVPMS